MNGEKMELKNLIKFSIEKRRYKLYKKINKDLAKEDLKEQKNQLKIKRVDLIKIFRIVFIIIFLSAAVFRIFFFKYADREVSILGLNESAAYFIIIFEIFVSLLLMVNRFVKFAVILLISFLSIAIIYAFFKHFDYIKIRLFNMFIFTPEPDDILLHTVYLGILIVFYLKLKRKV